MNNKCVSVVVVALAAIVAAAIAADVIVIVTEWKSQQSKQTVNEPRRGALLLTRFVYV